MTHATSILRPSDRAPGSRTAARLGLMRAIALTLVLAGAGLAHQAALAQTVPTRHTVDSDGHPMALWEKRPERPRGVVLLIHGRTWSGLPDFDLQVPGEDLSLMDGLVEAGYAAYALDLRGYGGTPRDETGWISPDRAALDVAHALEWVAANAGLAARPHLFGWSLGSMVSQLTVQQRPELVSSVILFGYPHGPHRQWEAQEDWGEAPRAPTTARAAASDFITPASISRRAIDVYVEAALAADPVRTDWWQLQQWNQLDPAKVTVPTLVLHGEHDPLAPTESLVWLFSGLGTPDREWVTIPGGDHAAFLESPRERFLDVLVGFLDRH